MARSSKSLFTASLTSSAIAAAACSAGAALITPQSWTRGEGGTTYQHWDVFDTYPTDSTPDVGDVDPNGSASLTETTGQAFVTSGGNIYSFAEATAFEVTIPEADIPSPPHDVTVLVQTRILGTEIDYDSLLVNGIAPTAQAELERVSLGGFGGDQVDSWFLFNVPYDQFGDGVEGTKNLLVTFSAAGSSMSLDQLSIDTAIRPFGFYAEPIPAPEPASIALLACGGVAMLRRRSGRGG